MQSSTQSGRVNKVTATVTEVEEKQEKLLCQRGQHLRLGGQMGAENVVQKYLEMCVFTNCQKELFEILPYFFPLVFSTLFGTF